MFRLLTNLTNINQIRSEPVNQGQEGDPVPPWWWHVSDVDIIVRWELQLAPQQKSRLAPHYSPGDRHHGHNNCLLNIFDANKVVINVQDCLYVTTNYLLSMLETCCSHNRMCNGTRCVVSIASLHYCCSRQCYSWCVKKPATPTSLSWEFYIWEIFKYEPINILVWCKGMLSTFYDHNILNDWA